MYPKNGACKQVTRNALESIPSPQESRWLPQGNIIFWVSPLRCWDFWFSSPDCNGMSLVRCNFLWFVLPFGFAWFGSFSTLCFPFFTALSSKVASQIQFSASGQEHQLFYFVPPHSMLQTPYITMWPRREQRLFVQAWSKRGSREPGLISISILTSNIHNIDIYEDVYQYNTVYRHARNAACCTAYDSNGGSVWIGLREGHVLSQRRFIEPVMRVVPTCLRIEGSPLKIPLKIWW